MQILIPTYGRPDVQRTINCLAVTRSPITPVGLVMRPSEVATHGADWLAAGVAVHPLKPSVTTLSKTRAAVGKIAAELGLPWFMMMDDDLKILERDDNMKLGPLASVRRMMDYVNIIFEEEEDVASVSLSARFGNSFCEEPIRYVGRQTQATAYRTDVYNKLKFGRSEYFEDADRTIQILQAGYRNAILFEYAVEPGRMNTPGGCSTFRTFKGMYEDAKAMEARYPGIVVYKEKPDPKFWSDGKASFRPDINVRWRKAYRP